MFICIEFEGGRKAGVCFGILGLVASFVSLVVFWLDRRRVASVVMCCVDWELSAICELNVEHTEVRELMIDGILEFGTYSFYGSA
jgi:hypothetical protein